MLGERIYELRMAHGWNQVQLAGKLNITKQTVSNWENDNIQPSVEMLVRIAKLFRVSTDYLLGLDDTPNINVDGLPLAFVTHIAQIIDDYKMK
ncbi:MAG: helix-turn-helix transcriptional regulator [Clostridia bacterium]|nr:helix-turn-helix transcriptional regulator [Clostridia bacterium]